MFLPCPSYYYYLLVFFFNWICFDLFVVILYALAFEFQFLSNVFSDSFWVRVYFRNLTKKKSKQIICKMVERIQDLNLPNSNITKIIRDSLPADVNMDKGKYRIEYFSVRIFQTGIFPLNFHLFLMFCYFCRYV